MNMDKRAAFRNVLVIFGVLLPFVLIGSNTHAMRMIYIFFAERNVTIGEKQVLLGPNFFAVSKKTDDSAQVIGGFYTDSHLLPTESALFIGRYPKMKSDALEKLQANCTEMLCTRFEIREIESVRCVFMWNKPGFMRVGDSHNIFCPFPELRIMIEYHGDERHLDFFSSQFTSLLHAATLQTSKVSL